MHNPTDRIAHTTAFVTPVVENWLEQEITQWVHPMKDRSDVPSHHEQTLLPSQMRLMVVVNKLTLLDKYWSQAIGILTARHLGQGELWHRGQGELWHQASNNVNCRCLIAAQFIFLLVKNFQNTLYSTHTSIHPSIHPSTHPSIHPSIYLSIYLIYIYTHTHTYIHI